MNPLNFSWLIENQISGHSALTNEADLIFLKSKGIKALVRMQETNLVLITSDQIKKLGFVDVHVPVVDFTAPTQNQIGSIITFIEDSITKGLTVAVSCGAGIGRTGTILACYLISKGYNAAAAMEEVKKKRGSGLETEAQKRAVGSYAKRLYPTKESL